MRSPFISKLILTKTTSWAANPALKIALILLIIVVKGITVRADLNDGLVGYWTMDAIDINGPKNMVWDRSGNGSHGTLVGLMPTTHLTAGKFGEAMMLTSTSTNITIPYAQVLNPNITNAFTFAAWIRLDTAPVLWEPIFYQGVYLNLSIYRGGLVSLRSGKNVPQLVAYVPSSAPSNSVGQWFHLAATYNGSRQVIYLNGESTCSSCSNDASGPADNISTLRLGGGGSVSCQRTIDEVRVYNRALSAQEIQDLYLATHVDTTPLVPPAAPENVRALAHTNRSITLSWNPNAEPDVMNYKLYKNSILTAVVDRINTSVVLSDLKPSSTYQFQVSAVNKQNLEGSLSNPLIAGTDSLESPVYGSPPMVPSKLRIAGTISPDATGVYLKQANLYNGYPLWTREDGHYSIYYINGALVRLSIAPGMTSAGTWKWDYQLNRMMEIYEVPSTGSDIYSGRALMSSVEEPGFPTPGQYMAGLRHPTFKSGHSLPPLTRWGWGLNQDANIEFVRWGYALEFGDTDAPTVNKLDDPYSYQSRMVALVNKNPEQYKLSAALPRMAETQVPSMKNSFTLDASNNPTQTWSPEAPDSVLSDMAAKISVDLKILTDKAPVSVILNGGERYLGVCGFDCGIWKNDSRVVAAKGSLSWADYIAQRKTYQELFFTRAVKGLSQADYIYYPTGNQFRVDANRDGLIWDWDYKWMHVVSDYPSASMYWGQFNTGWTGHQNNSDMLTQVLNAYGYDVTFGKPLSYNFVCAGWGKESGGWGDIERYTGFLKSYYTAGMISGVAGYFEFPVGGFTVPFNINSPPHWLLQMKALGEVHAEFSYLEDILRHGDLLPGPSINEQTHDQPAYEFRTGFADTRVLARKMRGVKRWLVSAWAADNVTRPVSVMIPDAGSLTLEARPTGCLYDVRFVRGVRMITQIDSGSMTPSPLILPAAVADPDGGEIVNQPPIVNAGPNQTVFLGSASTLFATIQDDGLPNASGIIGSTWTKAGGDGMVIFSHANSPITTVSFLQPGIYTLRCTATDGKLDTSDEVVITVLAPTPTPNPNAPPPDSPHAAVTIGSFPGVIHPLRSEIISIPITLQEPQAVRVVVINRSAVEVVTIFDGPLGAGLHEIFWDGKINSSTPLASGTYGIHIKVGAGVIKKKVVVVK